MVATGPPAALVLAAPFPTVQAGEPFDLSLQASGQSSPGPRLGAPPLRFSGWRLRLGNRDTLVARVLGTFIWVGYYRDAHMGMDMFRDTDGTGVWTVDGK